MKSESRIRRTVSSVAKVYALMLAIATAGAAAESGLTVTRNTAPNPSGQNSTTAAQAAKSDNGLVIEPEELPSTYPHGRYLIAFRARGNFVPVLHWLVSSGALPPGITLDDNGVLRGEAQRAGEYHFVLSVKDSGKPQQAVQLEFVINVVEAMTLVWKVPAHVTGNRIDGSVEVSNTTGDDIDLTFDAKAIAENGRATEIGYQHFPLKKGTIAMMLPFGETLPHGTYVIHIDVVGEVAKRNRIYRQKLETPLALQVVVGP